MLFGTEMWERFNYYGMRAILVLYMVKFLMLPEHSGEVVGYAAVKGAFESVFGALDVQPLASQIFGFFMALTWGSPLIGGWIADRYLGQRRSGLPSAALSWPLSGMSCWPGTLLILLRHDIDGDRCRYVEAEYLDPGRQSLSARETAGATAAFSIFYLGINVGGPAGATWLWAVLGEDGGLVYGFVAAGVGMLIGMAIYAFGQRHLPVDEFKRAQRAETGASAAETRGAEGDRPADCRCTAYLALLGELEGQQFIAMMLWTDGFTDRHIGLLGWSVEIPNPALRFQALVPFLDPHLHAGRDLVLVAPGRAWA